MKHQRFSSFVLIVCSVGVGLLLMMVWLAASTGSMAAFAAPFPDSPVPALQAEVSLTPPEMAFLVNPDPPMAGEPTELSAIVFNPSPDPRTYYAQFFVGPVGLGLPLQPVSARLPIVTPPFTEGSAKVTWVPPTGAPASYAVWLFDALDAPAPLLKLAHQVIHLAHPDPALEKATEVVTVTLRNPTQAAAQVALDLAALPATQQWQVSALPQQTTLEPGQVIPVRLTFNYTGGEPLPPSGVQEFKLAAMVANGPAVGDLLIRFGAPVQLHLRREPIFAESEISIDPYPVRAGEPVEICVVVRNLTIEPRLATLTFRVGPFGIGLPFYPAARPLEIRIPPLGMQRPCIQWVPPASGQAAVEVQVETPGYPLKIASQRIIDVSELLPEASTKIAFPVRNPLPQSATITLEADPHLNWPVSLDPPALFAMSPGETRIVTMTVTIPPNAALPMDGQPVVDVRAFAESNLVGGFRKLYRPSVPIHRPADPIYAEREITVFPYPPRAGEPTQICVELRNPTDADQTLAVDFNWAQFGIGMPWYPIGPARAVTIPAHGLVKTCITWVPPVGGRLGFEVGLTQRGQERIYSQRVIDVGEVLVPNTPTDFTFPVRNPTQGSITVTLTAIKYFADWKVSFDPSEFTLGAGEVRRVVMHVTPVQQPGDPAPAEGDPVIDVEAYADGRLIGGFRKLFFPPVPVHVTVDPPYAEREIQVMPYPPEAGEPTHLSFIARNPTDQSQQISVGFEWSPLGIGLPFQPIGAPVQMILPPHSMQRAEIVWVPPFGGEFCVRVKVMSPDFEEPFFSARNISIIRLPRPYGTPERFQFLVSDGGTASRPLTVTLGLKTFLPGWQVDLASPQVVLQPGEVSAAGVITITPPASAAALAGLADGTPVVDIAAFANGELIGGIRKIWRPPVPLGEPGEPTYAESEIRIVPYPPRAGVQTTFTAEVRNLTGITQTIQAQFGWADFGFGIPFTTTNVVPKQTTLTLGPYQVTNVTSHWTPSAAGHTCIQIRLTNMETGERVLSQRNVDVVRVREDSCQPIVREFVLQNPTPLTITVTMGVNAINLPVGWTYTVSPESVVLEPYESVSVTLVITPPCPQVSLSALHLLLPSLSQSKVQVEGYSETGELIGGIEVQLETGKYELFLPTIRH